MNSQLHKVWGNEHVGDNGRRKMSMGKNAGDVDMVVFGHDIDLSEQVASTQEVSRRQRAVPST